MIKVENLHKLHPAESHVLSLAQNRFSEIPENGWLAADPYFDDGCATWPFVHEESEYLVVATLTPDGWIFAAMKGGKRFEKGPRS
jgi:hypothetical protein